MVKLLRVDDRLLHGQVAVSWTGFLGVDTIVIANDKLINDKAMQMAMNLAKPSGVTLSMKSLEGAIQVLNNPKHADRKILVIAGSPADALHICKNTDQIKEVMVGGQRDGAGRKKIRITIYLNGGDMKALEEINALGITVSAQEVPISDKFNYQEIIKEYDK